MSRRRTIIVVILLLMSEALIVYGGLAMIAAAHPDNPGLLFPACVTEDSPGPCYWDADTRGNQQGTSFVVTKDGAVIYLPESETK